MNGNERKKQMKSRVISYAVGLSRHRKLGPHTGLQLITARINHSPAQPGPGAQTQDSNNQLAHAHNIHGEAVAVTSHNHIQSTICLPGNYPWLKIRSQRSCLLLRVDMLGLRNTIWMCDSVTACLYQVPRVMTKAGDRWLLPVQMWGKVTVRTHTAPPLTRANQGSLQIASVIHAATLPLELETKVKRRFTKISQSRRRPLLVERAY